jgi:hypothetical protein
LSSAPHTLTFSVLKLGVKEVGIFAWRQHCVPRARAIAVNLHANGLASFVPRSRGSRRRRPRRSHGRCAPVVGGAVRHQRPLLQHRARTCLEESRNILCATTPLVVSIEWSARDT